MDLPSREQITKTITRPFTGENPVVSRKTVGWIFLIFGILFALAGIVTIVVELVHAVLNVLNPKLGHMLDWKSLSAGAMLGMMGLGFAQTASFRDTIAIIGAAVPLFRSQRPGGNRSTDPPKE